VEEDDARSRHHAAPFGIDQRAILPNADLAPSHPIVGAFDINVFEIRARGAQEHRVEAAEQRDVFIDVLVTGGLKGNALGNDV